MDPCPTRMSPIGTSLGRARLPIRELPTGPMRVRRPAKTVRRSHPLRRARLASSARRTTPAFRVGRGRRCSWRRAASTTPTWPRRGTSGRTSATRTSLSGYRTSARTDPAQHGSLPRDGGTGVAAFVAVTCCEDAHAALAIPPFVSSKRTTRLGGLPASRSRWGWTEADQETP